MIHPSYPKILAELTPEEARLLNLTDEWNEKLITASEKIDKPPSPDYANEELLRQTGFNGHLLLQLTESTKETLPIAMFDLETRHGLIHFYGQKWEPRLDALCQMRLTPLGIAFLRMCGGQ